MSKKALVQRFLGLPLSDRRQVLGKLGLQKIVGDEASPRRFVTAFKQAEKQGLLSRLRSETYRCALITNDEARSVEVEPSGTLVIVFASRHNPLEVLSELGGSWDQVSASGGDLCFRELVENAPVEPLAADRRAS
ncbi:MAG: hypothetical protein ACYTFT_05320 [Planctomycetota bacterium]|jgi:hypothetical protein